MSKLKIKDLKNLDVLVLKDKDIGVVVERDGIFGLVSKKYGNKGVIDDDKLSEVLAVYRPRVGENFGISSMWYIIEKGFDVDLNNSKLLERVYNFVETMTFSEVADRLGVPVSLLKITGVCGDE